MGHWPERRNEASRLEAKSVGCLPMGPVSLNSITEEYNRLDPGANKLVDQQALLRFVGETVKTSSPQFLSFAFFM